MPSLFEEVVDNLELALDDPSVVFYRLNAAGSAVGAPRRIVWSYSCGKVVEPTRAGGTMDEVEFTRARQLYSDQLSVFAQIWAESFENAMLLRNNLIVTTRRVLKQASRPGEYHVVGGQSWMDHGAVVTQGFLWNFAVLDEVRPLTAITGVSHVGMLNEEQGC